MKAQRRKSRRSGSEENASTTSGQLRVQPFYGVYRQVAGETLAYIYCGLALDHAALVKQAGLTIRASL
jgi:hypothetical protein